MKQGVYVNGWIGWTINIHPHADHTCEEFGNN